MMNHSALTHLETERLALRPLTEEDHSLALRISSDPATTKYLYFWGRIGSTPASDARGFLDYVLESWRETPIRDREYCLVRKDTGESVGVGSVEWVREQPGVMELGWILLPECRGKGYATEAGRGLLGAAFEVFGAKTVIAHCDSRNIPSRKVMERLGMALEEITPEARPAKRSGEKNALPKRPRPAAWESAHTR